MVGGVAGRLELWKEPTRNPHLLTHDRTDTRRRDPRTTPGCLPLRRSHARQRPPVHGWDCFLYLALLQHVHRSRVCLALGHTRDPVQTTNMNEGPNSCVAKQPPTRAPNTETICHHEVPSVEMPDAATKRGFTAVPTMPTCPVWNLPVPLLRLVAGWVIEWLGACGRLGGSVWWHGCHLQTQEPCGWKC